MFNSATLQKKWAPLLEAQGLDSIKDNHRRAVTAQLLENQGNHEKRPCEHHTRRGQTHDFEIPVSRTQMYRQMGNSVAVPVIKTLAKWMVEDLKVITAR